MIKNIKAIDFFCGIGGVTRGFLDAGIDVIAGIDIDKSCKKTYKENNIRPNDEKVKFYNESITEFDVSKVRKQLSDNDKLVLIGCAPCQPFTTITDTSEKRKEERQLLDVFAEKVLELNPDYIFIENVSGLKISHNGNIEILESFVEKLSGYNLKPKVKNAAYFGVPQNRKRLIIFGKKNSHIPHPEPTHGDGSKNDVRTLGKVIGDLPSIVAGETHPELDQHQSANLHKKSLERLGYQKNPGDGMETWPQELMLPSRKERDYSGHTDVYSRLWWDKPSSTLTTKFQSISNGRFGHPVQNRALSILEGLLVQTFPENYQLFEKAITIRARQIGNAVPVKLAEAYAKKVIEDINQKAISEELALLN
jgi:DNA (cytosine-5)-methyltransferase 1